MTAEIGLRAVTAHARDVPVALRTPLGAMLRRDLPAGSLLLQTCHRVEAYLTGPLPPVELPAGTVVLDGVAAARHAVTVAVGADSVVVGEDQVLHQLRAAVAEARGHASLDPGLDRLFAIALRAGRRARSWRSTPGRSLADLAVNTLARRRGSLQGRPVLIVGAGAMGAAAARTAAAAGAVVAVASRTEASAHAVAEPVAAATEAFDPGPAIERYEAIIVALSGPWTLGADTVEALVGTDAPVVDLSVPLAVPDRLVAALRDRLVSGDDLARSAFDEPTDGRWGRRLRGLIDDSVAEYLAWEDARGARTTADALRRQADRELESELSALWRRVPDLDPSERQAIEGMTRRLAGRLLREPLEHLGRDRDGRSERAVREIFSL